MSTILGRGETVGVIEALSTLFEATFGEKVVDVRPVRGDASNRKLFRLTGERRRAIGVAHQNLAENAAFVGFSRHFRSKGLPVPEIYADRPQEGLYLESDYGDETLATRVVASKTDGTFPESVRSLYEESVRELPRFQILGHQGLDYALCYQFDRLGPETMEDDLRYFRECFLGLLYNGPLDEEGLLSDFRSLVGFLIEAPDDFFLYRDFQSRNIMVLDNRTYFIDYQSGRRGPLAYDLASLLYDARAGLDDEFRGELLETYLGEVSGLTQVDREQFLNHFPGFVLIRILQALGAYGNLGINRGKSRFLKSIPYALSNLKTLLAGCSTFGRFSVLCEVLRRIIDSPSRYLTVPTDE